MSYTYDPAQKISLVHRGRHKLQRKNGFFPSSLKGHWKKAWEKKKGTVMEEAKEQGEKPTNPREQQQQQVKKNNFLRKAHEREAVGQ